MPNTTVLSPQQILVGPSLKMGGAASKAAPATAAPAAAAAPATGVKATCCGPAVDDGSQWGMLPDSKRKCRDMGCCLFFALFCACAAGRARGKGYCEEAAALRERGGGGGRTAFRPGPSRSRPAPARSSRRTRRPCAQGSAC